MAPKGSKTVTRSSAAGKKASPAAATKKKRGKKRSEAYTIYIYKVPCSSSTCIRALWGPQF